VASMGVSLATGGTDNQGRCLMGAEGPARLRGGILGPHGVTVMTQVSIYDPFADVFPELFRPWLMEMPELRALRGGVAQSMPMRLDVMEGDTAYVVKADLPGVPKNAIAVDIDGNRVTIRADIKHESEQKNGARTLRSERCSGSLARSFSLSDEIDESKAGAKYENGVLELTLPKKTVVAGKRLSIQ